MHVARRAAEVFSCDEVAAHVRSVHDRQCHPNRDRATFVTVTQTSTSDHRDFTSDYWRYTDVVLYG